LLKGSLTVPGVTLRQQDRWRLVTTLIAFGDSEADQFLADEENRDQSGEGLKFAWIAQAARPDAATKQKYFDGYLHSPERPEDWIEGSLGPFNAWNQTTLTAPYLAPAFEALGQIKRTRKIFFLMDWLGAFIGGQDSAAAQAVVHGYLREQPGLDRDLRLKILQVVDELDRTVKIRARWG
jgi:aminopeptidase N